MGKKSKQRSAAAPSPERDAALEHSLAEVVPGFALLDTELEFAKGRWIHLLGVDAAGALVLGLSVAGERPEILCDVLDVLNFEQRFGAALRRHLDDGRLVNGRAPRLVLISESYSEGVLQRLAPLRESGVEPFELRALKSKRRKSMFLVRADGESPADLRDEGFAELVAKQDAGAQGLARRLAARLRRLDPDLTPGTRDQTALWTVGGLPLVQLELQGDVPQVRLGTESARPLADEEQLEILLDEVVGVYGKLCEEIESPLPDLEAVLESEDEVAEGVPDPDEDGDWV